MAVAQRPALQPITDQPLFQGITYSRRLAAQPQPQVIHLLSVDLTAPGLKPFVTPGVSKGTPSGDPASPQGTLALRTSKFLRQQGLQVAVNANFFYPFWSRTPWHYRPREGTQVYPVGLALSEGEVVSPASPRQPSLCFLAQRAEIRGQGDCPPGTQQAVAGSLLLLADGQLTALIQARARYPQIVNKPYPLNIAALSANGEQLWLLLVDGKQPLYSEGMTLTEAAVLLQQLGAAVALQLDGGGSTTLAIDTPAGPQILNSVIHAVVPGLERPVANHLGFFANPFPGPQR